MVRRILAGLICIGFIALAGCASIPVDRLSAGTSMITTGGTTGKWQEIPMTTVQLKDLVYMLTYVQWEPVDQSAGSHDAVWLWQRDGKVVHQCESKGVVYKNPPFRLWCRTQAAGLGIGHFRVTLGIDGKPFAEKEFDVVEATVGDDGTQALYVSGLGEDVKASGKAGSPTGPLLTHCPNALQIARDLGFPSGAFEAGLREGSVTLAVVITPSGSLKKIRVVKSTDVSFDQAAIDAAASLQCNGAGLTQDTEIRWEIAYRAK